MMTGRYASIRQSLMMMILMTYWLAVRVRGGEPLLLLPVAPVRLIVMAVLV